MKYDDNLDVCRWRSQLAYDSKPLIQEQAELTGIFLCPLSRLDISIPSSIILRRISWTLLSNLYCGRRAVVPCTAAVGLSWPDYRSADAQMRAPVGSTWREHLEGGESGNKSVNAAGLNGC